MASYPMAHAARAAAVLNERLPRSARRRLLAEPEITQTVDVPVRVQSSAVYRMVTQDRRAEGMLVVRVSKGRRPRGERQGQCEVGCTVAKLDYKDSGAKMRATSQQKANNGRKIDRKLVADGTIAGFGRKVLPVEKARQATMDADRKDRRRVR